MLDNKKILVCVTGGIAVYKSAALTSKLVQAGAQVKVIMSESATKFVMPLTFQALSKNDVYIDTFDEKIPGKIAHIELADWADVILVAPATANIIGKLANGIADDMISTTLLAATAPVMIAPAMNVHMYHHKAVQRNMAQLREDDYLFMEPSEGYLACGYVGKGRLEEPETIVANLEDFFAEEKKSLSGRKVLITAGPTRERIDPVRYISNFSSGKMGYALAEVARSMGAEVTLVSGPVSLDAPAGVKVIKVESASEMYEAVMDVMDEQHIIIGTAAVADYKPAVYENQKVKKQAGDSTLELTRTKDILREVGKRKTNQILIGFAAETNDLDEYAKKKLVKKNADMIVANNVTHEGAGFGTDTNIVTLYKKDGSFRELPLLSKAEVAKEILKEIESLQVNEDHSL
ncbi:bifunctional phosphopantothenoylcysteine decarboxylase/phosphopantothenate--cysteine ligase CoaBC [Bacillus sp. FJAT-27986]|uniref:bifunctional phosphopantothenoylcysteine decarboxylase/phosphopantothenate--cysteine ligase CoaBC n=1 Tax=Bacillus sp. FJAT-27986 TaxID=1743146 RepID=UPI00080AE1D2|nr:bifunctional phosphopantothenoylcysteine decarboxylase/phosphopantothenate--cysteine ligase CoaBC [Bacillus sp. FJAT-27986]OCA89678.1 phosphopantothenoylcysteine decarboxylase [Bacillus sp. FJAT-27986]